MAGKQADPVLKRDGTGGMSPAKNTRGKRGALSPAQKQRDAKNAHGVWWV
jgi:hypothetical protein